MMRTRGIATAVAALAVIATSNGVLAGPAKRVEEAAYVGGTPPGLNLNATLADKGIAGVVLPGGPEKFVSVALTDDSGLPASFAITQDTSGDGVPEIRQDVCGESAKPVKILPNRNVVVYVFEEPCGGAGGVATSGTVTATFSKGRAL